MSFTSWGCIYGCAGNTNSASYDYRASISTNNEWNAYAASNASTASVTYPINLITYMIAIGV